ncbi:MAG TPA: hypothetical protein VHZ74_26755 [Bryobacteraceae bacterium]|jgi:hypothetical protein|nr:hypothetical protein [Bryobacteraceae bacterium]
MQLSGVFLQLGEERLPLLLRGISIGKLKTFQLYERFKTRTHLTKVNTESLRKAAGRFWARLNEHEEEFATDLSQAILISHMDMIAAVLNFLGVPNEEGFFAKDLDAKQYLTEGWQARVWEQFKAEYPDPLLLFYINHLDWELGGAEQSWLPGTPPAELPAA